VGSCGDGCNRKRAFFPNTLTGAGANGIRSLREFDDKVTAPLLRICWRGRLLRSRLGSAHVIERIAVPALVLYAANDPFVRITPETRTEDRRRTKTSTFVETADGGHCAFVGVPTAAGNGSDGRRDDGYWAESEIVNFLRQVLV
jgi:uncharacterized protein